VRVLVACEFSGTVRDAFTRRGHTAVSCDLLPSETPGRHYCGDVRNLLLGAPDEWPGGWDLLIAHPPCTHLAVSGARHFAAKRADGRQQEGIDFFMALVNAPIPRIVVENPVCIMSSVYRKPDQVVQPWQFGHPQFKATCLWLKGLPKLRPTKVLTPPAPGTEEHKAWSAIHRAPPGPDRWKFRSTTFAGIAEALADQYGDQTLAAPNAA
jgi:hypothetical protein